MDAKKFLKYKLMTAFVLAFIISFSVARGNFIMAPLALAVAMVSLFILRKKVREIIVDERDEKISGKASYFSMMVFCTLAALAGITFFAIGKSSSELFLIGQVLAYSACAILVLYSVSFYYFRRK